MSEYRGVTNARGIPVPVASGGSTPGGSDTYVQYNDAGTLAGDAGFTYDDGSQILTALGGLNVGSAPTLGVDSTSLTANTPGGYASIGDEVRNANGTHVRVDDAAIEINVVAYAGSVKIGDPAGRSNSTTLNIDDANSKATLNKDFEFTLDSVGPILVDRTTATKYRLYVDSGVLGIETI